MPVCVLFWFLFFVWYMPSASASKRVARPVLLRLLGLALVVLSLEHTRLTTKIETHDASGGLPTPRSP